MLYYVVIPAYNEAERLPPLLEGLAAHVPLERVVVVDDGSREPLDLGTPVRLLRHHINLGKGMALRTGCEYAIREGAEAIVLMDGDGQHEPGEIPRLLGSLDRTDFVFAARQLDRQMPVVRRVGNLVLNSAVQTLFGSSLTDIWCGYRAFRVEHFSKVVWNASDYAVDVEMAIRALKHQLRFEEVPIGTVYHDAHKGVTVLDGLQLLARLVGWKFTL